MKNYLLFLILVSMAGNPVFAQKQPQFTASLSSDSVLLGHYFKLTYTLENAKGGSFSVPELGADMEVLSGPNTSSSFSVINGQTSQKTSYTLLLRPMNTGSFVIPPASVESDGQVLESQSLEIRVLPNPESLPQRELGRQEEDFFQIDLGDLLQGLPFPRSVPEEAPKKKRKTVKI